MRQSTPAGSPLVRSLAMRYPSGAVLARHAHPWAQLVHAVEGVMTVDTDEGTWVVPSRRAVWIPGEVGHAVAMSGPVSMRTLYLAPALVRGLPRRCCVVPVSPLLRELALHVIERGFLPGDAAESRRLARVLVDQLRTLREVPLALPEPRDERAVRVARRLRESPGDPASVDVLAREAGTSRRTLERLFRRETGLPLGRWRQQARILHAMRLLARGAPVTGVALEVGYESPSAFVAAFRRATGTTPGRYYRAPDAGRGRAQPSRR